MKTLEFWQQKWSESLQVFMEHRSNYFNTQVRIKYEGKIKLKKLHGHGLNNEYDGFKIHHRRDKWLKQRVVNRTEMAMHHKEMLRFAKTKLDFFERRIIKMGGKINENFAWQYREVLRQQE